MAASLIRALGVPPISRRRAYVAASVSTTRGLAAAASSRPLAGHARVTFHATPRADFGRLSDGDANKRVFYGADRHVTRAAHINTLSLLRL